MKLVSSWAVAALAAQAAGAAISHKLDGFTLREHADPAKRALLQKYVCCISGMRDSLVLWYSYHATIGDLGRALDFHQW